MYPPPPPPPPIVYIWYHIFAGPKWNFEKTKRIYFVIVTVVIWTLSWKHEQLRGENFSCITAGGSQFLTNFHNPNQIAQSWPKFTSITKFHNSDQNSQFWSVWCGGLETAGGGGWSETGGGVIFNGQADRKGSTPEFFYRFKWALPE